MRRLTNITYVLLLFASIPVNASAALFQRNDVLQITLEGPLDALGRSSRQEGNHPFVLRTVDAEETVQVRARGHSRLRVCKFPPLRLEFDPSGSEQTPFVGQTRLKLVTHCNKRASSEVNLLEEYLAYRIFNMISDISYKVRLARIRYVGSDSRSAPESFERYGFFIESAHALAARVGGQVSEIPGLFLSDLELSQTARVFVFQYLIGNTDWSLVTADHDDICCHNVDLFQLESGLHPVPYDFDLAGLVNARYARPDPSLRIGRVTKRLYRGYCIDRARLAQALAGIRTMEASIVEQVRQLPVLSTKEIDRATKYLRGFFEQAQDERKLVESFEQRCI